MSLRSQGNRLTWVEVCAPRCQLSLEEGCHPHRPGWYLVGSDHDIVEVRIDFNPLRLEFLPNPHKHLLQRQAEQSRSHNVSVLHPTGVFELSPFSRVHVEEP